MRLPIYDWQKEHPDKPWRVCDPDYEILIDPTYPEQCCQDDFFFCPDLGETPCEVDGVPDVGLPIFAPIGSSSSSSSFSSSSSSSSTLSSSSSSVSSASSSSSAFSSSSSGSSQSSSSSSSQTPISSSSSSSSSSSVPEEGEQYYCVRVIEYEKGTDCGVGGTDKGCRCTLTNVFGCETDLLTDYEYVYQGGPYDTIEECLEDDSTCCKEIVCLTTEAIPPGGTYYSDVDIELVCVET